jgi:hypothetical protein
MSIKYVTVVGKFDTFAEAVKSVQGINLDAVEGPVVSTVEEDPQKAANWELVVSCLSPTKGTVRQAAIAGDEGAATIFEVAYLLCDGFGQIDGRWAREQCWDWSHVRDSSDEALARCADYLRSV